MNTTDHTQSIDVDAPVRVAYNQWTQFERFPEFMSYVDSVTQLSDDMVRWSVKIAGVSREFDTRITEQMPDQRIAWNSETGPKHGGVVTFHHLTDDTTRVTLQMDFDPEGFFENVAEKAGFVDQSIETDLVNFKKFIEDRELASGAWRGAIVQTGA